MDLLAFYMRYILTGLGNGIKKIAATTSSKAIAAIH
jgi:hypothetical protein